MTVVTRFPPSPTGYLHIGSARTALFNWLYARHHKGKFLLRVEDTDRERYSQEAVDAIFSGMNWLELNWDEEALSQFARRDRHVEVAMQLLEQGKAYYCYATPAELEEMRETAQREGRTAAYDRRWRDRSAGPNDDLNESTKPVIRIKAPLTGESVIEDEVQGSIKMQNEDIDDFILVRSDGTPTYMLSVVVDDHDMGVTHVIRGDDHLNNAFRQKVIIESMGWNIPVYAHIPLILGPDGSKMSKRHGAISVESYRDMGYLPEAMRNYLLRLSWSHGNDEIISTEDAIDWFNLESIGKSAARFDFAKLDSLNAYYIKQSADERIMDLCAPLVKSKYDITITQEDIQKVLSMMGELKERSKTLVDLIDDALFLIMSPEEQHKSFKTNFDDKVCGILDNDALDMLAIIQQEFMNIENFKSADIQALIKNIAKEHCDGKMGKLGMPLRAALTGKAQSPGIFDAAATLGRQESLNRIQYAIQCRRAS